LFQKVRNEKFLSSMRERTEPASWAAASLVAQPFAEKFWVVKELGCAVAQVACIPIAASTGVIKLLCARFTLVGQPTASLQEDRPTAITATVVKRTTSVVV
jgi:hypothetical protein